MLNLIPQPRQVKLGEGQARTDLESFTRDETLPAEGYRLELAADGARISAADAAGQAYAKATLDQIRHAHGEDVRQAVILDWPDFPSRG